METYIQTYENVDSKLAIAIKFQRLYILLLKPHGSVSVLLIPFLILISYNRLRVANFIIYYIIKASTPNDGEETD